MSHHKESVSAKHVSKESSTIKNFPTIGRTPAKKPLEFVHSDVCRKISTPSLGEGIYFLTFIDDNTYYVWVCILKTKDQVF